MTTFVPTNQETGEYDTKQAIQHLQGGAGPGVPAGVLHGTRPSRQMPWSRMQRRMMERSEMLEETGELSGMICLFHLQPPTI